MDKVDLLERAKHRRLLASMALRKVASKRKMTPEELKKILESAKAVQSKFGAPKDSQGNAIGKAGRTLAFIHNWLREKAEFGLPPVGDAFNSFVRVSLDKANHIWGHEDAAADIAEDIHYNFGFDPTQVELVGKDEKEPQPVEVAQMNHIPEIVSKVKMFTKKAEAYQVPEKEDYTNPPVVPVVTRVDYTEDMEAAKKKGQFGEQPIWNKRNVGINDLLKDLSSKEFEHKDLPKDPVQPFTRDQRYPKESKAQIKGFVKKN